MTLASRRLRHIVITVVLAVALVVVNRLYDLSLRDTSFLSGWLLATGIGFLAAYNLRKKLPFLPLLQTSIWLQLHLYVGWLIILLFFLHTGFKLPRGPLEVVLWGLFATVAVSGVLGMVLSRIFPRRLRLHGENILFERIPRFRAELASEVEALALRSVTEMSSTTIADCYAALLQPYFCKSRNLLAHLIDSKRPLQRIRRELTSNARYLNEGGKEILEEIDSRIIAKDNLDYQYALQRLLKGWLFIHIPMTYSLILFILVHVVLAYAFAGGVR